MSTVPQNHAWRAGPGVVAALTLFGIVTGLGVTEAVGCMGVRPWILEPLDTVRYGIASSPWTNPLNVVLSMGMLALAGIAAVSGRRIALTLMSVEFVGFVLYLFLRRGGYAVGIIGVPIRQVMQFDALSVAARVGVLGLLAFGRDPSRRLLVGVALAGAGAALVIVGMKAALHPLPAW